MDYIKNIGSKIKEVEGQLAIKTAKEKNEALKKVAESIDKNREEIIKANNLDMENGKRENMSKALLDRLLLNNDRIDGIIDGIKTVIKLQDPIWQSDKAWTLENGLNIQKISVPLGVIGIIYESRPNVTVDAFALGLKSGNCMILRGSSSAINSNRVLVKLIKEGLEQTSISKEVVQFIDSEDRDIVMDLLKATEYVDLVIPRGGRSLIQFVIKNAQVPTLQTGEGNCHIFIDEDADLEKAVAIVENAKMQRLGVCNACETLLVHEKIKDQFLPKIQELFAGKIEIRGCGDTGQVIDCKLANEDDFKTEFLDAIIAVKIVKDIDEAIAHINKYGTKHSEAILTEGLKNASKFQRMVDASTVYVNASTRFTDGSEFGFGAEMGISTQKIHARGPIGLEQLVTYKYLVLGQGHIRK